MPLAKPVLAKALDAMALSLIFMQMTEFYRPLGLLLGFPSSRLVNVLFLGLFILYLVANVGWLRILATSRLALAWVLALLVIPMIMMGLQFLAGLINLPELVYWTGFMFLFLTLFLVSSILTLKHLEMMNFRFYTLGLVLAWFGFFINLVDYDFIRKVLIFTDNRIAVSESTDRVMGFYPHPNHAAFSIVLLLAFILSDDRYRGLDAWKRMLVVVASFVGVFVTGSRTSLLLVVLTTAIYLFSRRRERPGSSRRLAEKALRLVAFAAGAFVTLVCVVTAVANLRTDIYSALMDRLARLLGALDAGLLASDESASLRVNIISDYAEAIVSHPLLGYGPEYARNQITAGYFANVSQNTWLEWAVQFGSLYPIFVAVVFWSTYRLGSGTPQNRLRFKMLFLILFIGSFSLVDILWHRTVVVALAVLLSAYLAGARRHTLRVSGLSVTTNRYRCNSRVIRWS